MCGGTRRVVKRHPVRKGLSPRVRGNHPCPQGAAPAHRSIPACAGEPCRKLWTCRNGRVYPRVCGGTWVDDNVSVEEKGLSPRVRGNRHQLNLLRIMARSIPACAGEPSVLRGRYAKAKVYPRVCGGTPASSANQHHWYGLSPRVRGNRVIDYKGGAKSRSIPACAGEPGRRVFRLQNKRVYPRVCGGTQCEPQL